MFQQTDSKTKDQGQNLDFDIYQLQSLYNICNIFQPKFLPFLKVNNVFYYKFILEIQ